MTTAESASKILDTLLGHLGVTATIELEETPDGPCLQVHSNQDQAVIGRDGDRLDDLQYLVNRILRRQFPQAERIKVDCAHFRSMREDEMCREITAIAERVRETGRPFQLRPLNAYYRRMVHNILMNVEGVESHSPDGEERLKRITIAPKA